MRAFRFHKHLVLTGGLFLFGMAAPHAATVPANVHPNWTKIDLRPAGFQPQVSGMIFQSDGKLLIAHWNSKRGLQNHVNQVAPRAYTGRLYLLSGVTGTNPSVTVDTLATGLEDVMGLTLVNDTIYVSGGNAILRLIRAGGLTGPVTRRDTIFFLPGAPVNGDSLNPNRGLQEYLYGLLHRDGKFYVVASSLDPSTQNTQQINPYRGTLLEVTPGNGTSDKRGAYRIVANGLRAPSGISFGPDGTVCGPDNQGEWLPASKLICIQEGRYYGARKSSGPNNYYAFWDTLTETPPTAWVIQNEIGNSPTQPVFSPSYTPFADQILMGDVRWGTGINRYFLEKNAQGQLQAAVFVFTGGLEAGVFRMAWGPDSMLYIGMIGGVDDNDGYPKNLGTRRDFGLQKLRYTGGDTAFEMRAIRSRPAGFEIEFTKAVDSTVALASASYTVQSYHMTPSASYGAGAKQGTLTLTPKSILLSPDRRKVYLSLDSLVPSTPTRMRVVYFKLNGYKSAAGDNPWATEAWYSLNDLGTGTPFDLPVSIGPGPSDAALRSGKIRWSMQGGLLRVQIQAAGPYSLRLRDLRGNLVQEVRGEGPDERTFSLNGSAHPLLILEASGSRFLYRRLIGLDTP